MTKKVCVTGGAGMIGSRLVRALRQHGYDVAVVDNLWRGSLANLAGIPGFHVSDDFHNIDLSEARNSDEFLRVLADCNAVIHLADIVAGIGYVFNHQYEVFRINNLINTNTFHSIARSDVRRVIYAGTACSFPKGLQQSLESILVERQLFPAEPESAYGWSKLMGSLELQFMAERSGFQTTTLMLHNVYGPNCDLDPKRSQVIPAIMRRIVELNDGEKLAVWGSGRQGRAFVHVDDIVAAFLAALQRDNLPPFIQIGPNHCTSIKQLVEMLRDKVVCRDIPLFFDMTKPEGDIGRCADYSLAENVLGWTPKVTFEDGLRETYRWIEAQLRQPVSA
jgi:GDP-D-mannose 3', 5'-epimerase